MEHLKMFYTNNTFCANTLLFRYNCGISFYQFCMGIDAALVYFGLVSFIACIYLYY